MAALLATTTRIKSWAATEASVAAQRNYYIKFLHISQANVKFNNIFCKLHKSYLHTLCNRPSCNLQKPVLYYRHKEEDTKQKDLDNLEEVIPMYR